ncbi:uncharacterized protein [Montipora foliosa]|uniref:uncharacterized protein n=1 Tax=Montipora foliosa TaxID=591990 RepID=UPI0035F10BA7
MSRQAAPRRNIYYNDVEMRCKEEAIDGGIYDFVVENAVVPEPKQVPLERQASANKRAGTLALAFKMILAQNNLANDCSTLRELLSFSSCHVRPSNYGIMREMEVTVRTNSFPS